MEAYADKIISGHEAFPEIRRKIIDAIAGGDITFGADIDGTIIHAQPGEHKNVPLELTLTSLFNDLNSAMNGNAFMLTGRPQEFVKNTFGMRRDFLVGTEHGSVISRYAGDTPFFRIGNRDHIINFRKTFEEVRGDDPDYKDLQIEDYKIASATIGFTHMINPNNEPTISSKDMERMRMLTKKIVDLSNRILEAQKIPSMQVVDTVTPSNAVVEIIPVGACKAESLQYLRDEGCLRQTSLTVFAGDSNGDRTVKEKVASEGGICLGVGENAPDCSHVKFSEPEALVFFLRDVLSEAAEMAKTTQKTTQESPSKATQKSPFALKV